MFNKKAILVFLSIYSRGIQAGQPFVNTEELTTKVKNYSRNLSTPPSFESFVYNGKVWGMTKDLYPGGNNISFAADHYGNRILNF